MAYGNPEPWLRKGRGWFVTLNGKQVNLRTTDKAEAFKRWHELMAGAHQRRELGEDPLLVEVLATFCDWAEKHLAAKTYRWYHRFLLSLVGFVPGTMRSSQLKPLDVTQWLDANPTWNASGRRAAITAAKRALNWAVEQGILDRNPIASLKRPAMPRRTSTLTPEQRKLIFESAGDSAFRELLLAVELSGVRPQEVRAVEARHFDPAKGTWVFPIEEHKTGARTGKPRVVFLPPTLVTLCEQLARRWPQGPLFRNSRDDAWTANAIRCRFKRLRERLKGQLPNDLCLYLYRHTYATDALENGLNPVTVAELLGHADAATLSRVYQHVADRHDHMSQAAVAATSQTAARLTA